MVSINALPPWLMDDARRCAGRVTVGNVPHALIVHGQPGVGRHRLVAWMVQVLLNLPGERSAALEVPAGLVHPDFFFAGPDADETSIRIERIRALTDFLNLTSTAGARKVAVIAPAEQLNLSAANALLKTLEEPPGMTTIVLIAASLGRLPATIVSRCERLRIRAPSQPQALEWLRQQGGDQVAWPVLLELVGGGPLAALDAAADDVNEDLQFWEAGLAALAQRTRTPLDVAREFAKRDRDDLCLAWLYRRAAALIRRPGAVATSGRAPLQYTTQVATMAAAHGYLDRVVTARRQLGRALNREFVFADLLTWWYGRQAGNAV